MNGLVRQYLSKGIDLAGYSQEQLDAIVDEINNRPKKGLGVRSPLAVDTELLLNCPQHTPIETRVLQFTIEYALFPMAVDIDGVDWPLQTLVFTSDG